ncbi:hypothetical protein ABT126_37260 [Streptomyces sp. NPDC002012]|uniref:hypothetical protein n=1 Tax=Streptomyces sp. NPDC002012 TaxID=3154532 RepID=UPI00332FFFB3
MRRRTGSTSSSATSTTSHEFIHGLEHFAGYVGRHGSNATVATGGLEAEIGRLVGSGNTGGLVCRIDQLADRLHELSCRS